MDPELKAKLESDARKQEYKQLLDEGARAMENTENNSIAANLEALTDLVCKSDVLIGTGSIEDRVGQSSEVVLDAQVVKLAHDLLGATVHKIESEAFDEDEFVTGLRNFLQDDDNKLDFSRLDPIWCKFVKRFRFSASLFSHLDFSLDAVATQPTQRQRRQNRRSDYGTTKKPTTVQQSGNVVKKRKVDLILEQIVTIYQGNGNRAFPYYALIIDPDNMVYTFDNSFQLSFLLRDGFISLEQGDDGYPTVRPIARTNRNVVDPDAETISSAPHLSSAIIQEHIKRYNIRKALLKIDRDGVEAAADAE